MMMMMSKIIIFINVFEIAMYLIFQAGKIVLNIKQKLFIDLVELDKLSDNGTIVVEKVVHSFIFCFVLFCFLKHTRIKHEEVGS